MTGDNQEYITISLSDLKAIERLAVVEAGHEILVNDFQKSRDHVDETLIKIFDKVDSIPGKITACKDTLEDDIKSTYMTKTAGVLLEQNIKSIKWWIVSTVGGFTGAGVVALWLLNVKIL